jgi:hypothetical protein
MVTQNYSINSRTKDTISKERREERREKHLLTRSLVHVTSHVTVPLILTTIDRSSLYTTAFYSSLVIPSPHSSNISRPTTRPSSGYALLPTQAGVSNSQERLVTCFPFLTPYV